MKTVLTTSPDEAAEFIKRGGLVAFPTETVYGLGANVFNERAIAAIFDAKRRPADNPLIAHVSELAQIGMLAVEITESAARFIDAFFPGPLTIVVRKSAAVPLVATAGLDTIGLRMPGFEIARRFIAASGAPIVAPSANVSGRPSPTTWQAVAEDLDGRIDCILQADPTEIGLESTVVDCSSAVPVVLRHGSVTIEELRTVVPVTAFAEPDPAGPNRSPGLAHRHYSPRARVVVVDDTGKLSAGPGTAFVGLTLPAAPFRIQRICRDVYEYGHDLFEFFRECDRQGIQTIYCERVGETGIGKAVMDRINRAAAG